MSRRRKRFIQECARSTTHLRALKPATRLIALAASPRGRTCARLAERFQHGVHLIVVVAGLQTPSLWVLFGGLWPLDDQAFARRTCPLHLLSLGPFRHQANRHPLSLREQAAFNAGLAPVGGSGPRFFPHPAAPSSALRPWPASPSQSR